jgi:hypothetical protein
VIGAAARRDLPAATGILGALVLGIIAILIGENGRHDYNAHTVISLNMGRWATRIALSNTERALPRLLPAQHINDMRFYASSANRGDLTRRGRAKTIDHRR